MKTPNHRADASISKERPVHFRLLGLFLAGILAMGLSGCSLGRKDEPSASENRFKFVVEDVTVLRFDPDLHYAELITSHGNLPAWWDGTVTILRGDKPQRTWDGHPGDKVHISGFLTNGEICIRKVILK
jgi:hypothetical protein